MEVSITEQINMAMVKGSKLYQEWAQYNHLPEYLVVILYELLIHQSLTQKDIVRYTGMPKQSINKGIKLLLEKDYLRLKVDKKDKRIKFCQLTNLGKRYAQKRIQPLIEIEEKTSKKMGDENMKNYLQMCNEWNDTFKYYLDEQEERRNNERI